MNKFEMLERKLLEPKIRTSVDDLSLMIADNFQEIAKSAKVYTKNEVIQALAKEKDRKIEAYDFNSIALSDTVCLITYKTKENEVISLRSSIWIKQDQRWQIIFHQGTSSHEE